MPRYCILDFYGEFANAASVLYELLISQTTPSLYPVCLSGSFRKLTNHIRPNPEKISDDVHIDAMREPMSLVPYYRLEQIRTGVNNEQLDTGS